NALWLHLQLTLRWFHHAVFSAMRTLQSEWRFLPISRRALPVQSGNKYCFPIPLIFVPRMLPSHQTAMIKLPTRAERNFHIVQKAESKQRQYTARKSVKSETPNLLLRESNLNNQL